MFIAAFFQSCIRCLCSRVGKKDLNELANDPGSKLWHFTYPLEAMVLSLHNSTAEDGANRLTKRSTRSVAGE